MEHASVLHSFGTRMERSSFTWNIANFMQVKESDEQINAQKALFKIGSAIGLPLKLKCYLRLTKKEGVRSAGIYVQVLEVETNVNISNVIFQLSVSTPFQAINIYCESLKRFTRQGVYWGLLPLDLSNRMYYLKFTQDHTSPLPIQIVITLYNLKVEPISVSVLTTIQAEYETKFCRSFAKDLKQLGNDSKNERSIATLVSKDGVNFQVDKSLLAVRCPELCKLMGQGPMGIDSEALGVVLHFLNTGTLSTNWSKEDVLPEVALAVGLYKLKDLKDFLNVALGQVCTKKNADKLLLLAKKLGMKRAKKEMLYFIRNNFDEEKLDRIRKTGETSGGWGKQHEKRTGFLDKVKMITGF